MKIKLLESEKYDQYDIEAIMFALENGKEVSGYYGISSVYTSAAEMYANQFKHPAYDLLLASYNTLKAEDNKKAMEINRLMSGRTLTDEEIEVKAEYYATKYSPIQAAVLAGKWVRHQLNKK